MSAKSSASPPFSRLAARVLRFGRCRKGAAAVEFALGAPSLFLVVMGIFEFGLFAWNRHSLEHATEETARVVMTKTAITDTQVAAEIKSRASSIPADEISATVTQETVGTTTFVTMSVAYTYNYILLGAVIGLEPIVVVSKTRVPLRPGT
jgi:Flp pilus assembly protein TadG